jgi:hypothetical protein
MTTATGMVIGAVAAFAAALIGLAPPARSDEPDPFQLLFGNTGLNAWTPNGGRLSGHQRSDPRRRLASERRHLPRGRRKRFIS